jgi:hypothetical protein
MTPTFCGPELATPPPPAVSMLSHCLLCPAGPAPGKGPPTRQPGQGGNKPPASPLRPKQEQQQQPRGGGGSSSRPSTPPGAAAAGDGGGGAVGASGKQQQTGKASGAAGAFRVAGTLSVCRYVSCVGLFNCHHRIYLTHVLTCPCLRE